MEEQKKKKVLVVVLVLCLVATVGVLWYGFGGSSEAPSEVVTPVPAANRSPRPSSSPVDTLANIPLASEPITHQAPAVFPAQPNLDLSVFESSKFSELTDYVPLTVNPSEISRENPFLNY